MIVRLTSTARARRTAIGLLACSLALASLLALPGCGADGTSAGDADSPSSQDRPSDDASLAGAVRHAAEAQDDAEAQAQAQAARQAIEEVAAAHGSAVSVTYLPVGAPDAAVSVNGDVRHSSASMIKLLVLAALLDKAAAGEVDLDGQVQVAAGDIVAGTGTVQVDGPGAYTLRELARRMIADSDNTATNVIVDLIGMEAVNEEAAELGLKNTVMARKMMDTAAASQGMQNRMSSDDAAAILNMVASGTLVNREMSDLALEFLMQQTIDAGLTDAIPDGVAVAHKTGELTQVEHDGGIVLAAKPYVLVVMTEGMENLAGVTLIAEVSRAVYVATNGSEGVPAENATAESVQQAVEAAGDGPLPWEYEEPGVPDTWWDDGWSGDDGGWYDDGSYDMGGDSGGAAEPGTPDASGDAGDADDAGGDAGQPDTPTPDVPAPDTGDGGESGSGDAGGAGSGDAGAGEVPDGGDSGDAGGTDGLPGGNGGPDNDVDAGV